MYYEVITCDGCGYQVILEGEGYWLDSERFAEFVDAVRFTVRYPNIHDLVNGIEIPPHVHHDPSTGKSHVLPVHYLYVCCPQCQARLYLGEFLAREEEGDLGGT